MRLRFRISPIPTKAYAFGSTVKERTISYTQKYRFGFNNQEQESELGDYYSFEYRVHDTRLGRFLSVDPLAPQYPWNSTYAFAENRVIDGIDLEGREWQPVNDKGEACAQSEATDYLYVGFTYTANGWIAPEGTVSTATINAGGYTLQYNSSIQNNWVDKSILSENLSPCSAELCNKYYLHDKATASITAQKNNPTVEESLSNTDHFTLDFAMDRPQGEVPPGATVSHNIGEYRNRQIMHVPGTNGYWLKEEDFGNVSITGRNAIKTFENQINSIDRTQIKEQPLIEEGWILEAGVGALRKLTVSSIASSIEHSKENIIAAKGGTFGERLFLSEKFGITSTKYGSSAANAQGTLNQGGGLFKAGWSTGTNSVGQWGYKFRVGIGSSSANPNIARFHMYVPRSFVPNSFANPSIQVKRSLFNLGQTP